jgi:hypothetical protein
VSMRSVSADQSDYEAVSLCLPPTEHIYVYEQCLDASLSRRAGKYAANCLELRADSIGSSVGDEV